jgi:hypothetical protein
VVEVMFVPLSPTTISITFTVSAELSQWFRLPDGSVDHDKVNELVEVNRSGNEMTELLKVIGSNLLDVDEDDVSVKAQVKVVSE